MTALTPGYGAAVRARRNKVETMLSTCFAATVAEFNESHAAMARWAGINKKTIGRWLSGESPVNTNIVLATPQFAERFLRHLCRYHAIHVSAPYVARKRARVRRAR